MRNVFREDDGYYDALIKSKTVRLELWELQYTAINSNWMVIQTMKEEQLTSYLETRIDHVPCEFSVDLEIGRPVSSLIAIVKLIMNRRQNKNNNSECKQMITKKE